MMPENSSVEMKKPMARVVRMARAGGIFSLATSFLRNSEKREVRTMAVVMQARTTAAQTMGAA